ncbi:MAG: DegT/DnrJ/EryC1/StrS family aminotransferase, partial [Actinobacteria bacterium]|nr:DegT/DnrJ/EryC1/StrS family aminotransferase [Actinomycetota bacterium]
MATKENIKNQIFELVDEFYKINNKELPDNIVPVAGKVYDSEELKNIIEAALQGWWTENIWVDRFEDMFKKFLGVNNVLMVNSGSSANLLAIYALTSPELGERRIKKGDEVITVAAGFPTTINPIVQIGAIPVFLDVKLSTYSIKTDDLDEALSDRTRAIMVAHTLGNPFNVDRV